MHPQRKKVYKKEQRKRTGWRPMTAWLLAWIGMRFLHGAVIVSQEAGRKTADDHFA